MTDRRHLHKSDVMIDDVANWLMHQALVPSSLDEVFAGCVQRLHATGLLLSRAQISFLILHPLYHGMSLTWYTGQPLHRDTYGQSMHNENFLGSPINYLMQHRLLHMRRHLKGPQAQLDFPILKELQNKGHTDYFAYAVPFEAMNSDQLVTQGVIGSWTTNRPGGFTETEISALMRIEQRLAVAIKIQIQEQVTHNILSTYLGEKAGNQVLNGSIKRGDGQLIPAVIWYSDLRDSTRLAGFQENQQFLDTLNQYFECTAGSVARTGGEVLRFIGDAVLAIYPTDDKPGNKQQACQSAAAAARLSRTELKKVNNERGNQGLPELQFGIGLHIGDVLFGNIGIPERLEFSVIGPATNEVARLEDLSKSLNRPVIASQRFIDELGENWPSFGKHHLRGVDQPFEVFTAPWLDDDLSN